MYCPHCGVKNQEGNRYCTGCGSELPRSGGASTAPVSARERIKRLYGATRRERLLSVATVGAIVIAAISFWALKPDDDIAQDSFTRAVDRSCVAEKQRIAALEAQTAQQRPPNVEAFSAALVSIIEEWRSSLQQLHPPQSHVEAIQSLDSTLLDVLIEAGALARVARDGTTARVASQAQLVDNASARVNRAIEDLGLTSCSEVAVEPAGIDRP